MHLAFFICTKFSATSSKAWPSWWCQAENVLELWYNLCTHTYLPMLSLKHISLFVHFWRLLLVIHCQPAHSGAESNVAFLWHFNTFSLLCPKAGLWEHSGKSCVQRTRTLCGTYVCIYLLSHGGRGKSLVAFPRRQDVATHLFCCIKYIPWLPSVVKFPTNSLPAVLIGLEETKLRSVIWAFRSMLFITIFYNGETVAATFWNRTSSVVH